MHPATAVAAFGITALVFASLLVTASVAVAVAGGDALRPVRMAGPAVKRWSGYILIAVGLWFLILAVLPGPILAA